MSPYKMINPFLNVATNFTLMWIMGKGAPQGNKNEVSRTSAIFMINITQ